MDIKAIIEKLKNIDAKDLQNIDTERIKNFLRQKMDILIIGSLVFVAIIFSFNVLQSYGKKMKVLKWDVSKMQERVDAAEESEKLQKEYTAFMTKFPQSILTGKLIGKLSEFAANRDIQILAFAPDKEKSDEYVEVARVKINVSSKDYKRLVLFMRDIEDAPYTMRVEKWSGTFREELKRDGMESVSGGFIESEMEIGSVKLKDE